MRSDEIEESFERDRRFVDEFVNDKFQPVDAVDQIACWFFIFVANGDVPVCIISIESVPPPFFANDGIALVFL